MSVNKVILIGNVGKDPEVRPVSGTNVASFTLATTEKAYVKTDGTQIPERTEWHNIVVWGKLADVCANYIRKGSKLYIEGKLRTKSYDSKKYFDNTGQPCKQYTTEVFVDSMEMLDRPPQQQQPQTPPPAAPQTAPGYQPQYPQQRYQQPPQGYTPPQQGYQSQGYPQPQGYPPQQPAAPNYNGQPIAGYDGNGQPLPFV